MRKFVLPLLILLCISSLQAAEILVAAASDLAPLEQSLAQEFQKRSGTTVRFTFGSSGSLMNQIAHGAPFDLFLAANERYVRSLVGPRRISGDTVRIYALGRIALWSKSGKVKTLQDLTKPEVKKIGLANAETAPYGAAARQALNSTGLWPALKDKVVYGESVRQTLQFAESGNVDVAIVSWSLVQDKGGVLLPIGLNSPIKQTGGLVAASKQRAAAMQFLDFLTGPDGQKILQKGGLFRP